MGVQIVEVPVERIVWKNKIVPQIVQEIVEVEKIREKIVEVETIKEVVSSNIGPQIAPSCSKLHVQLQPIS